MYAGEEAGADAVIAVLSEGQTGGVGWEQVGSSGPDGSSSAKSVRGAARGGARNALECGGASNRPCHAYSRH